MIMIENILMVYVDNVESYLLKIDYINPFLHKFIKHLFYKGTFKHNSEQGFNNEQLTIINLFRIFYL